MTEKEKVTMVQALVDYDANATDAIVAVYLAVAKDAILTRLYPHGVPETNLGIPPRYEMCQTRLAARYFLRRGAEGEISHSENGIGRTYGSVNDADLLNEVIPYAKVVSE